MQECWLLFTFNGYILQYFDFSFHQRKRQKVLHATIFIYLFVFVVWLTNERRLALFLARTIVRDPHHRESPTRREQDLNLRRTRIQALLNEFVQ